ncbi:MAG: ROK family protein [Georgenia sp.]
MSIDLGPTARVSASQADLRAHNLALLTRTLFASAVPVSRAELAGATGMTRSTVSRLVEDLIAAGIVSELEPVLAGGRGRPAVPLVPAARTFVGLGLEVNVDQMLGQVIDLSGAVVTQESVRGNFRASDAAVTLRGLGELAVRLVGEARAAGCTLIGTALALPGLVHRNSSRLLLAPNLGWQDVMPFELLDIDLATLGDTRLLVNDANAAARALALTAPGRPGEVTTFLYVSAKIGVGSAIVVDSEVTTGRHGFAGEIGHLTVVPDGRQCRCGARGCLEQYAGKAAVLTAAGLPDSAGGAELLALADSGPAGAAAREALDTAAWALGVALASTANLLDVEDVILGGDLAPLHDRLRPGIERELARRVLSYPWSHIRVSATPRQDPLATTGGAFQILSRVVDEPARFLPA